VQRIKSPCHTSLMPAARTSGERELDSIRLIVLHDTEGGDAAGIAGYFRSSSARGSAHLVVDDRGCYRCLPDNVIPWGAANANSDGFHIEQCGYASWSKARWLVHSIMLHRAAYKIAVHCRKFDLPVRFVDAAGLAAGHKGVTTHAEVSAYTREQHLAGDDTHSDPGSGYPIGLVLWLARHYHKGLS
jgi:hypothetical protein